MKRVGILFLLVLVLGAVVLMRPLAPAELASRAAPITSYEAASAAVRALQAEDGPEVDHASGCGTQFLSHGQATDRVIVIFHGLTNCPEQFDSLAHLMHARGANVLIPRLPRHGLADRMTDALARSDAAELRAATDRAVDIARGLGRQVTVMGLSVGGTMAAWAAQRRADVSHAVVIAPLLEPPGDWPQPLGRAATRLASALPNTFVWWNDTLKTELRGPKHVYPRFATRAAAASLWLGADVLAEAVARRVPPGCRSVAFVTVEGDKAVGARAIASLMDAWRTQGCHVEHHEFAESLGLNHDMIDPDQVEANPAVSYPVILRLADY